MLIIGCDFHPGFQQVAIFDNLTGEITEKRILQHRAEVEQFLPCSAGRPGSAGGDGGLRALSVVRAVAGGSWAWKLWLGDAAKITGQCGAEAEDDGGTRSIRWTCCARIAFRGSGWPSLEVRDVRQLLVHRHKQVQARTRTKNQLQAMALSSGVQKKRKLWSKVGREELEQLPLLPYAGERRKRLLETLDSAGGGDRRNWTGEWRKKPGSGRKRCG